MTINITGKTSINAFMYGESLRTTITEVLNKIGEDFRSVKWIVCDEAQLPTRKKKEVAFMPTLHLVSIGKSLYGCCDVATNEIYISVNAIHHAPCLNPNIQLMEKIMNTKKHNLLVNVILDELAHIKTGKNHGDKEYDSTFEDYKRKYYGF